MGFETLFYCKIVKAPLKVRRRVKGGKLQESSAQVATSQSCCVWIYFGLPLTARVGLFCRLDFAIDPPTPQVKTLQFNPFPSGQNKCKSIYCFKGQGLFRHRKTT